MTLRALGLAVSALAAVACSTDTEPLFPTSSGTTAASSGAGAGGGGEGAGGGGGGGTGGAAPTCDPSSAKTACDTCVYGLCCAEAGRCGSGSPCDAFSACAKAKGCFDKPDFLACAAAACPAEATSGAVADFQALRGCIRADCKAPCGL